MGALVDGARPASRRGACAVWAELVRGVGGLAGGLGGAACAGLEGGLAGPRGRGWCVV
jgi:hypothetical protein